ncbi:MAG: HAD family hydrolase [Desulfuromonadaceae bacterium]|nr:HAD family hydrolase [Desulfuromonadaceae bacterium]MDD2847285.1 HAD family hydrolase [Desulfuromonadaceae bacterium]MDD4130229.1 HAD family hydrolase [Desulfuromonadaceae bacterium]
MAAFTSGEIRAIVFDLDGTLYVCDRFAAEIHDASAAYIAGLMGISQDEATHLMAATRARLTEASGTVQTISAVCVELGGDVQELHNFFVYNLRPETYLVRDERVITLLGDLAKQIPLYIYTNNNRVLTTRIITYLGLDRALRATFTIDDTWRAKPDEEMVKKIVAEIGLPPNNVLFVGDRYDVDLRVPEQLGCPVYLSQSLEQLLRLKELLTPSFPADKPAVPADQQAARS